MGENSSPFTYLPLQLYLFLIFIFLDKTKAHVKFIQEVESKLPSNSYIYLNQEERR